MKNFGNFFKKIISTKKPYKFPDLLYGKQDLPSIKEFTEPHSEYLEKHADLKGMFTSDPKTIKIAERILEKRGNGNNLSFFEKNILSQPNRLSQECNSIKVSISDINDFAKHKQQYEISKKRNSMICVGGPAAEDQAVLASIVSEIREKLDDIIYVTRDYKESNVNHSAKQSHARHGNALNADKSLTGHALMPVIIMRKLLGVNPEDTMDPDYKKIDVKFTIDPKKLRIYFANELNWLKQEYKKYTGQLTEHDINRLESVLSQEILHIVEKQSGLELSGNHNKPKGDSSSIHVVFTEKNDKEVEHENEEFQRVGIKSEKLTPKEMEFYFGDNKHIHSAYRYPGDTHLKFNTHEMNSDFAKENDVKWIDYEEISKILTIKNEKGNAEIAGIVTKEDEYIYSNKLHFTGGYKVDYIFDPDSKTRFKSGVIRNITNQIEDTLGLQNPLNNKIITATGVSINAVFKKSDRLKNIIEKHGSTGEIAVTNSHWTMIADDENYLVMRITGGGNTGSEEYNPSYFLNAISNTRRIFGDDLVGVLSTYGCPRAVNAKNSTEFAKIAEGGIISYGKGGTGNTKRHAEAAFGLMMVGFDKEVIQFFNQFQNDKNKLVGEDLKELFDHSKKLGFFHDNIAKTNRRMGYDKSLSAEEMAAIGLFVVIVSYGIYKGLIKENNKQSIKE